MAAGRDVQVHLLPELAPPLLGSLVVVIDVLRCTTTIVHALAAGCTTVRPCAEVEEARALADSMRVGRVLLAGERDGVPIPGFDLGNSPASFTSKLCKGRSLVLTTTNGTRALLRAADAERTLIAGFVNFSVICEQLRQDLRPVHIVCAGARSEVALEDVLLAGALVDFLTEHCAATLNDGARLAWDSFENHRQMLLGALEMSQGGAKLQALGFEDDIRAAAWVDHFAFAPELRKDPVRVEVGAVGMMASHWPK